MSMDCRFTRWFIAVFVISCVLSFENSYSQDSQEYIRGADGQLEMIVYIVGEVKRPGEYQVSDRTNVMDLISKAGGGTEFANLNKVTIARYEHGVETNGSNGNGKLKIGNKIIRYDANDYLSKETAVVPPVLKPGDTILVSRNKWHAWRTAFTVIRDLAVIASVYLLYVRTVK